MAAFTLIVGTDTNGNHFALYNGPEAEVSARVGDFEFTRTPGEDDGYDEDGYEDDDDDYAGFPDVEKMIADAVARAGAH